MAIRVFALLLALQQPDPYGLRAPVAVPQPFAMSQAAPTTFRRPGEMMPTGHRSGFMTQGRWFGTERRWFDAHAKGLFGRIEQPDVNASP